MENTTDENRQGYEDAFLQVCEDCGLEFIIGLPGVYEILTERFDHDIQRVMKRGTI